MKLRNKDTGKIVDSENTHFALEVGDDTIYRYRTIAEFADEWEDVSEEEKVDETFLEATLKKWKENGIKSELTGLTVAPENVGRELLEPWFIKNRRIIGAERDGKAYFTWDEAMEVEERVLKPNGWRLPTRSEWVLLAEEFGQDENGELNSNIFRRRLNLPLTGNFWQGTLAYGTAYAFYWSRVSYSTTRAYDLHFNSSGEVNPQSSSLKMYGYAIRCVAK